MTILEQGANASIRLQTMMGVHSISDILALFRAAITVIIMAVFLPASAYAQSSLSDFGSADFSHSQVSRSEFSRSDLSNDTGRNASWSESDHTNARSKTLGTGSSNADPFAFSSSDLDTIQFSRASDESANSLQFADRQTEFSLNVRPAKPKFSLSNGFGLNMIGQALSSIDVESGLLGPNRLIDSVPRLHDGLAYSAGVKVEHEDEDIDGTAYVSSGLLGISYGRLGRMWYGGLDVNIEQFVNESNGVEQSDVINVDFTTGRRLGWTGTSRKSPLWLLSISGNVDVDDEGPNNDPLSERADWYLNPSLFWQNPGFTFSAQVQVPVEAPSADGSEQPDYRLRAVFEKRFR